MLATEQSNKSKPFASVRGLSGNPGSNGTRANGRVAASATRDTKTWFVLRKGARHGPYTFAALENMAEKGLVDPESGVWCLGWAEWRIARNVPGLFEQDLEPDGFEEKIDAHLDGADDREAPDREGAAAEKAATAPPPPGLSGAPKPAPPRESKRAGRGGGARLAVLSVLSVLMIVVGAGWAAISFDIIRVEFMPTGAALLKQVQGMLAGTCATP